MFIVVANFSWIPFFRPHLNRQFSSASFVRDPKLVSRVEALKYFEKLLYTISQMVNSLPERMRTLEGLLVVIIIYYTEKILALLIIMG